ncbi:MAG: Stf0 family sulfotransferase, partial [Sulfurimonas sp.]|nr:Stf0 family sulfotransferase [Sulfurimonas sp.]
KDDILYMEDRIANSLKETRNFCEHAIESEEQLESIAINAVPQLEELVDMNCIPSDIDFNTIDGIIYLIDILKFNLSKKDSSHLIKSTRVNRDIKLSKNLVILATQKNGSIIVCNDIAETGVLGKPSEHFIKVIENLGKVSSEEMKTLIDNVFEKGKTSNGLSAIKIMSNQIARIGKALKEVNISQGNDYQEVFYTYFKDSIFARVIRNDKVAQAVSRIMARQTNVYHTVDNASGMEGMLGNVSKKRDESVLHYDFEEIKTEVEKIKSEEKFLDEFIERFQLEVQPIVYEEVVNDRTYVNDLASKLNVTNIELADRRLKKVSGSVADEWVNQYKKTLTPAKLDKNKELPKEGTVGINEIGHRNYVGGLWDELGLLQISFLKARGLNADDILLDIACGPLRAGIHFIDYLKVEHYLGIDKEEELIRIGIEKELGIEKVNEKKPEFAVSDSFEFSKFSKVPDYSIAQSLFTHLIEADIQLCLINLKKFIGNKKHKFFATFFEADLVADTPLEYSHSLVNFFYTKGQMISFGQNAGWKVEYIGDWNHPRNQKMMMYYQD